MLTKNDLLAIKSVVKDEIRAEVSGLKSTVSGLVSEVGGIKSTVSGLVSDVGGLKSEVGGLKDTITDLRIEMDKKMDKNTGDLVDLITKGFGIQDSRHVNHEGRLTRLEKATFTTD